MNLNCVLLFVFLFFNCLQLVHTVLLFQVCCKVVLPPAGVIAQFTLKGFVISVEVHVISQSLPVSILTTTHITLMRFCL